VENHLDDYSNADFPSDSEIVITCPALGEGGGGENSTRVTVDRVTVQNNQMPLTSVTPTVTTGSESPVVTTNQLEEQNVGLEDYCIKKRPYPVENGLERAIAIREIYLNATSKEEVVTSKQEYSSDECRWVHNWLKRYQPVAYCQWQETQKRVGLS